MDHDADPAAVDQPPGQVSGDHHQIQPGTRRGARSGHGRDRTGQKPVEHAGDHQHDIPGQRPGIPGFALDGADVDPAALVVVYLIIGILYESYIHPLTILSTLPSAGVGALAILMLFHFDFSLIALIGIILLIGIGKKNGIMMVDFAIVAERDHPRPAVEAIRRAAILRFRPIMMTTMAAMLGGVPLMLGQGTGAEIRQPLGYAMVGG